jgi:hypothetical protein
MLSVTKTGTAREMRAGMQTMIGERARMANIFSPIATEKRAACATNLPIGARCSFGVWRLACRQASLPPFCRPLRGFAKITSDGKGKMPG